jgi:hypothetical protein
MNELVIQSWLWSITVNSGETAVKQRLISGLGLAWHCVPRSVR